MGKKIVDAKKDTKGNIAAVRFDGNISFTNIETAKRMADRDEINNAHLVKPKKIKSYLRSNPDGKKANNLDNMAK